MKIAVDFDGTIVEHKYPSIGKERPFAIDTLLRLQADGHQLILWTVRTGELLKDAVDWCAKRGLYFWAVNSNLPPNGLFTEKAGASRKVQADGFIDDANVGGLPEWGDIYEMISGKAAERSKRRGRRHHSGWLHKLFG